MTLEKLIERLKKGNLQATVLVETSTGLVELPDDIEHHKNYTTIYCRTDFCDVAGDCYELEQQEELKEDERI